MGVFEVGPEEKLKSTFAPAWCRRATSSTSDCLSGRGRCGQIGLDGLDAQVADGAFIHAGGVEVAIFWVTASRWGSLADAFSRMSCRTCRLRSWSCRNAPRRPGRRMGLFFIQVRRVLVEIHAGIGAAVQGRDVEPLGAWIGPATRKREQKENRRVRKAHASILRESGRPEGGDWNRLPGDRHMPALINALERPSAPLASIGSEVLLVWYCLTILPSSACAPTRIPQVRSGPGNTLWEFRFGHADGASAAEKAWRTWPTAQARSCSEMMSGGAKRIT